MIKIIKFRLECLDDGSALQDHVIKPQNYSRVAMEQGGIHMQSKHTSFFHMSNSKMEMAPWWHFRHPKDKSGRPKHKSGLQKDKCGLPKDKSGVPKDKSGCPKDKSRHP